MARLADVSPTLSRGWRRSAIVLAAVAVGLSACLVLIGWMKGMMYQMADNAIRTQLAHIAVQRAGYQQNPDVQRNLGADAQRIVRACDRSGVKLVVSHVRRWVPMWAPRPRPRVQCRRGRRAEPGCRRWPHNTQHTKHNDPGERG